ncbi:TPA_asm: UL17.5 uoORF [Human alphaherpesvirus 1]|nr:TPA_asm: UL17.5 uoORF [Human alphaherpesvirus 1]
MCAEVRPGPRGRWP